MAAAGLPWKFDHRFFWSRNDLTSKQWSGPWNRWDAAISRGYGNQNYFNIAFRSPLFFNAQIPRDSSTSWKRVSHVDVNPAVMIQCRAWHARAR
jgi:hypothetical protein